MHLLLLPVFPLLAGSLLFLLRGLEGPWVTVARAGSYLYAIFYTALDAIAGSPTALCSPTSTTPRP
nr:hypothetical protein GCM10020093_050160 [Planobispora longispora]